MKFTKMHGTGNSFICINCFREIPEKPEEFAKWICDPHRGAGADGLLLIKPSGTADFGMEIYNADGSAAKMCGNGIRCLGKYVYDGRMTEKTYLTVETAAGIRTLTLRVEEEQVRQVCVDMGTPRLNAHCIPILSEKDMIFDDPIQVCGKEYRMTGISMGNPHAVVFAGGVKNFPVEEVGRAFEYHPRFPERINTEFCEVEDRRRIRLRVWERGVGETLSCGTGACAAVVASVLNNLTDDEVTVKLVGGELRVKWDRPVNRVYMTGPAERVFEGML